MEDKYARNVRNILIPLGAVLIAALGLLAKNPSSWVIISVVLYISFVVLYMMFPLGKATMVRWLVGRRNIKAIKTNFHSTVKVLEKVSPQLELSRSGTVFCVWRDAASKEGVKGGVYADSAHFDTLNSWLFQIHEDISTAKMSEGMRVVRSVNAWLLQYAQLCDQARRDIEAVIRTGKLEGKDLDEVKQEWNHSRDYHNQVITEWIDVCREINRISGEELFNTYVPTLKPF